MSDFGVPPVILAMFQYDLHVYVKRCIRSMDVRDRETYEIAMEIVQDALGYEVPSDFRSEAYELLRESCGGDEPRLVLPTSTEMRDPLRLVHDNEFSGILTRVAALVGIARHDHKWPEEDYVKVIYQVLATLGYNLVQMRAVPSGTIGATAHLALTFDWRGNHAEAAEEEI